MKKPLAIRMEGKEMSIYPHSKESSPHSQTASHPLAMEAITNTLMAIMPLTVLTAMIDVLNGYGYTLHRHPSPGMFADTGCKANPDELVSPEGNFRVKIGRASCRERV